MTDNSFHFQREQIGDIMRRNREELYALTFARDYGFKAVQFVEEQIGAPKFFEEVGRQRAEARLNGRIIMDEQGNEHLQGTLDLAGFGLNEKQTAHVDSLRKAEVAVAPASHEVGDEGQGGPRWVDSVGKATERTGPGQHGL